MTTVTDGSTKLTFLSRIPCEEPGCPEDPHFIWEEEENAQYLLCTEHAQQWVNENVLGMCDSLQRGWALGEQSPEEAAQLMADYWLAALALLDRGRREMMPAPLGNPWYGTGAYNAALE